MPNEFTTIKIASDDRVILGECIIERDGQIIYHGSIEDAPSYEAGSILRLNPESYKILKALVDSGKTGFSIGAKQ